MPVRLKSGPKSGILAGIKRRLAAQLKGGSPVLFSSLVFLWVFLPVVLLAHTVLPPAGKNILLLCASLFFYAWGEPVYILLMLDSVTLNWAGGLLIGAVQKPAARRAALAAVVLANLGLLGYFKYYSFVGNTLAALLGHQVLPVRQIALPLGISFYTFQAMSYAIDLYRGKAALQKNWFLLALYISCFPQLVAGPIVRYTEIEAQLHRRAVTRAGFSYGIKRFLYGLGKKVLLANAFAARADEIFGLAPANVSTALAWWGTALYTLQIYYDFSGYSDMAVGLGAMLGFRFPENFNYPYIARSMRDFWSRWHISLSSWLQDYLFTDLAWLDLERLTRGRLRHLPPAVCTMAVFFCSGLWHGANWQFVVWGLWNGAFLVLEGLGFKKVLARMPRWVGHAYTLLCVMCGMAVFRAPGLRAGIQWLRAMWLPAAGGAAWPVMRYLDGRILCLTAVGILLAGPLQAAVPRLRAALYDREHTGPVQIVLLLAIGFAATALLVSDTYNPFIYFRF